MNEEQYVALCRVCDQVLLEPEATEERIAIPWLHVIRESPIFLENYADIFDPGGFLGKRRRRLLRSLRNVAGILRQVGRTAGADDRAWVAAKPLPRKVDVLLVSHLLNSAQADKSADFYFGNLPEELSRQGYSVVVALLNYSGTSAEALIGKFNDDLAPRVILTKSLGAAAEIALHKGLVREASRLKSRAREEKDGLLRKVLARAAQEALAPGASGTLRIARQIGALVSDLEPKALLVTHEGHAWERSAFAAARRVFPAVRCLAYQHAALFRLQHAIRRNLAPIYNPDWILTAGATSAQQLRHALGLAGVPVSVLGSPRSIKRPEVAAGSRPRVCLVLPEGVASECRLLFGFSVACAVAHPEIKFIWRLHPLMKFATLQAADRTMRNLPPNIELSERSLDEDCARSRWAIYRGSTAIVQAVCLGARPLYYRLPGEMSVDPLFELNDYRARVNSVEDFNSVVNSSDALPGGGPEPDGEFARKYCADFYSPFDVKVLISALNGCASAH